MATLVLYFLTLIFFNYLSLLQPHHRLELVNRFHPAEKLELVIVLMAQLLFVLFFLFDDLADVSSPAADVAHQFVHFSHADGWVFQLEPLPQNSVDPLWLAESVAFMVCSVLDTLQPWDVVLVVLQVVAWLRDHVTVW